MKKIENLFFEDTLKRWRFKEIIEKTGMSRERTNFYLKRLLKDGCVRRVKPRGKMPYYIATIETERFRSRKRLFGLEELHSSGLIEHIISLKEIKTAIVFGSFARGDFNKSSDIDLFIYGNAEKFEKGKFETKLGREIQLFEYQNLKNMKRELDQKLIPNIMKGFNIKGNVEPFRIDINV